MDACHLCHKMTFIDVKRTEPLQRSQSLPALKSSKSEEDAEIDEYIELLQTRATYSYCFFQRIPALGPGQLAAPAPQ